MQDELCILIIIVIIIITIITITITIITIITIIILIIIIICVIMVPLAGKGWCENSSCRRVLVTHADGRQTVEEIKNDLGIGATDTEAMILKLKAQGIDDVVGIDMSGSTAGETDTEPAAPSLQEAAKTAGVPATNGKTVSSPTAGRAITGGGARGTNDVFNQTSINIPAPSPSKKRAPGGESSLIFG
jgi:hypothetical protein